ncbi:hypothetical protein ACJMK2_019296 [Sinanodonta woodiana]|uniref:ParB/Sulfiredoxin domain-containing protein n=1 Tax=Sinanodonta woodiana TaxID=1069815 RepID=A0ABD3UFY8_SINWO
MALYNSDRNESWGGGRRTICMTEMRPSQLRFTHDSISCRFKDGGTMEEMFRQLLNGEISLKKIRSLVAMEFQGYWFVVRGNRRLYVMKKLEEIGKISTVSVLKQTFDQQVFNKQFSTRNMGLSLKVRGDPYMEQKLNRLVSEWRTNRRSDSFAEWFNENGAGSRSDSFAELFNYSGAGNIRRESGLSNSGSNYTDIGRQSNIANEQVRSTASNPSWTASHSRYSTPKPAADTSSSKGDGSWCVIL